VSEDSHEEKQYSFHVVHRTIDAELIPVNVGGVEIHMLIDSGSTYNVIPVKLWKEIKIQKVKCSTRKGSLTKVFAYGQSEPLDVIGVVKADVDTVPKVNNLSNVKFYVIDGKGVPLLGEEITTSLGVLKVGLEVNALTENSITERFPEFFYRYWEIEGFPVDSAVKTIGTSCGSTSEENTTWFERTYRRVDKRITGK
jgi:hypothetical protein